jgi:hypothetical protein
MPFRRPPGRAGRYLFSSGIAGGQVAAARPQMVPWLTFR